MNKTKENWREQAYLDWCDVEITPHENGIYLELTNEKISLATKLNNQEITELILKLQQYKDT